jgi:hypothetical protein
VYTYYVYMNVTLALDDETVARAREVARRQGTTLNDLIRRYLETIAGRRPGDALADELKSLWDERPGHSGGRRFRREDAYRDRLK